MTELPDAVHVLQHPHRVNHAAPLRSVNVSYGTNKQSNDKFGRYRRATVGLLGEIDHTWLGRSGGFAPMSLPLFQGVRREAF